ncbi:RHS repeat domain-containing protein [Wukongibacter sp. M2B1]|uniref:RHS repeat domain-containing protein n=1 Tax=Wukongibacter sp. M2B1 TaxID=3088895 RepID=UPI003D792C82
MLAAINSTQVEGYEYNKNHQLIKKYRNGKPQLAYSYNLDGNIKTITTSSPSPEEKIDYTYDPIGRLKTVAYKTDEVAKYSYNPDSTVNAVQYDTGIKINYNYTKDRDIEAITAKNPLDEIITQSSYQYDNNRNLISEAMDGKTTTYQYDELSRLKEVLYPTNITETFTYDGAGNRKTRTYGSETTTYIYDSKNMLKQSSKGEHTTFYYYDPDGNLIDKREDEKTTTYEYDGFGRQTKALLPDGRCQINKYNALDQRTESVENGIAKQYTYNGRNVIIEKDQGEEKTGLYIRGLELISKINKNDQKAYYLHNRHGDITQIVDGQGKTLNKYEYDPFGNLIKSTERINNKHKYAGEQYDEITGQYYLRARYYDPQVGRFTQEDTYRGDGLNLYVYVANNPLKYIDPSGYGKDGIVDNNQVPTVGDPERKLVLKNEYNEMSRTSGVYSNEGVSWVNKKRGITGPTLMEAAEIADHIYKGKEGDELSNGWKMVDAYENDSLLMGTYSKTGLDGTNEFVIANAGTEASSLSDWKNNIQQPFGVSEDIKNSIKYSEEFLDYNSNASITFVGHSKGGAEAAANALATNKNAILFNPATLNPDAYELDIPTYTGEMTTYIVEGEVLNNIFGPVSKPIGDLVYLPTQHTVNTPFKLINVINSVKNHSMDAVKEAIEQWEKE